MLADALTVPIGIWLAYSAIFASSPRGTSDEALAVCGAAIAALAAIGRYRGTARWQADTNIVLGAGLLLYAGLRHFLGDVGFGPFWVALLEGTMAAIVALWSVLYREPLAS